MRDTPVPAPFTDSVCHDLNGSTHRLATGISCPNSHLAVEAEPCHIGASLRTGAFGMSNRRRHGGSRSRSVPPFCSDGFNAARLVSLPVELFLLYIFAGAWIY